MPPTSWLERVLIGLGILGLLVMLGGAWFVWNIFQGFRPPPPTSLQTFVSRYPARRSEQQRTRTAMARNGQEVPAAYARETLELEVTALCPWVNAQGWVDGQRLPDGNWQDRPDDLTGRVSRRWFLRVPTVQAGEHAVKLQFNPDRRCRALPAEVNTAYVVLPRLVDSAVLIVRSSGQDTLQGTLETDTVQAGPYQLALNFRVSENHLLPVFIDVNLKVGRQTFDVTAQPKKRGINGAEPQHPLVLVDAFLHPPETLVAPQVYQDIQVVIR